MAKQSDEVASIKKNRHGHSIRLSINLFSIDVECICCSQGVQLFQDESESDKSSQSSNEDNVHVNDAIQYANEESNGSVDVNDCTLSDTSIGDTNGGFL